MLDIWYRNNILSFNNKRMCKTAIMRLNTLKLNIELISLISLISLQFVSNKHKYILIIITMILSLFLRKLLIERSICTHHYFNNSDTIDNKFCTFCVMMAFTSAIAINITMYPWDFLSCSIKFIITIFISLLFFIPEAYNSYKIEKRLLKTIREFKDIKLNPDTNILVYNESSKIYILDLSKRCIYAERISNGYKLIVFNQIFFCIKRFKLILPTNKIQNIEGDYEIATKIIADDIIIDAENIENYM